MVIGRRERSSLAGKLGNAGETKLMKKCEGRILNGEDQEFPHRNWSLAVCTEVGTLVP